METLIAASFDGFLAGAWNIGKVLAGLGFVIFVHELGHFLVAKACGVQCDKFYVGFDVPIKIGPLRLSGSLIKFQWGETEYGVGIIPLGGYVKMLGQDDNPNQAEEEAARIKTVNEDGEEVLNPRSYPAKNVPQRMAIISAGVIMNLIFGVFMAAAAYQIGTPIQPASVGGVAYGSAAWQAGWQPGEDLVGFSEDDQDSHFYRYTWDLRYAVIGAGMDGQQAVPFRIVGRDGSQRVSEVVPVQASYESNHRAVGITSASNSTVAISTTAEEGGADGLLPGDEVIEVAGVAVPLDQHGPAGTRQRLGWQVREAFAQNPGEPVEVKVNRDGTEVALTIAPVPMKSPGFVLGIGPITAFQLGSKAETLGFVVGDVIQAVNGEDLAAVGAVELPQYLAQFDGQDVIFGVQRQEGDAAVTVEISVSGFKNGITYETRTPSAIGCLTSLGIAYSCNNVVTASNNPKIKVGDELVSMQLVQLEGAKEKVDSRLLEEDLNKYLSWFFIHGNSQNATAGVVKQLKFKREGIEEPFEIIPDWKPVENRFRASRGVIFSGLQRVHQAESFGEAMGLGWERTKQDLQRVGQTLGWIANGTASVRDLGGPVMIIQVAQNEAAVDVTRLLLFLTMLSANLAILNFLPIPVLDGGHFVFLTIELITRKPVSERIQGSLSVLFLFLLLGFMLFIVSNDILRLWF